MTSASGYSRPCRARATERRISSGTAGYDSTGAGTGRRRAARHRHHRRRVLRHLSRNPSLAPPSAGEHPAAHLRSAHRARRRRGLCHARLSVSAQCGRRSNVVRRRPAKRLSRLREPTGHSRRSRRLSTPAGIWRLPARAFRRLVPPTDWRRMPSTALPGVLQARRGPDSRWVLWLDDGRSQAADDCRPGARQSATGDTRCVRAARNIRTLHSRSMDHRPVRPREHEQRPAGGQRPHHDRCSAPARRDTTARAATFMSCRGMACFRKRRPPLRIRCRGPTCSSSTQARGSVLQLTRAIRTMAREIDRCRGRLARSDCGAPPADTCHTWRALDPPQRAQFLRHLRAHWEVNRHRVPAGPLAAVRALARSGVLDVHAGRLEECACAR